MVGINEADIVDISVSTDKTTYHIDEEVRVYVSAYNPNPEPVTLTGGFYFCTYIMDDVYNWVEGRDAPQVIIQRVIDPYEILSWDMVHSEYENQDYFLNIGNHTVVGQVLAWELEGNWTSEPVEFEVIPEPSSLLLLSFGMIYIRRYQVGKK